MDLQLVVVLLGLIQFFQDHQQLLPLVAVDLVDLLDLENLAVQAAVVVEIQVHAEEQEIHLQLLLLKVFQEAMVLDLLMEEQELEEEQ